MHRLQLFKTHLVASYDSVGINGGCNSYASTIKGNHSASKGLRVKYHKYCTDRFMILNNFK
jgi:hypothetical protein